MQIGGRDRSGPASRSAAEVAPIAFARKAQKSRRLGAMVVVVVLVGLVGGVALASLAGARRTASTFAAYEHAIRFSDVVVNTPVPDLDRVVAIAALPGVKSSATYVGLNAFPAVDGEVVDDFRYTGMFGSLDGSFFTQDRATVLNGRLPRLDATDEVALTPAVARFLRLSVGDVATYLYRDPRTQMDLARESYRVVGIVSLPPVIVDEFDIIDGAILPPDATKKRLDALQYAFQGVRLADGTAGIDPFARVLGDDPAVNAAQLPAAIQRSDETRAKVQRSVRPQALALALFGAAAALAALALGFLTVSRVIARWSADAGVLRALGLTHRQVTATAAADAVLAVLGGSVLAVVVAVALSPLAPVGAVRDIAPSTAVNVDLVVLLGGFAVLATSLIAGAAFIGHRLAAPPDGAPSHTPSRVATGLAQARLPLAVVLGFGLAGGDRRSGKSVLAGATLAATTLGVIASVAAVVFGASLSALASHPARYGWNWNYMLIDEAGYGSLSPTVMNGLIEAEPEVDGWSMLAFNDLTVAGVAVPTVGIDRRRGAVEPPVVSGRAVAGPREIALGVTTLSRIGKSVGDLVRVAKGDQVEDLRIVGAVTFPAIGRGGADHTSLGRGALVTYDTLARLASPGLNCSESEEAICPNAVVFDVSPGKDGEAVTRRIASADPGGVPGGTYEQPVTRPADIRNYNQMSSLPIALASLLAGAAIVAVIATILSLVRARRRELAVLKALGATGGQLRASVAAQVIIIVATALGIGLPLGIAAGRVAWIQFTRVVGVVDVVNVPLLDVFAAALVTIVACAALAMGPATVAARTVPARELRTE